MAKLSRRAQEIAARKAADPLAQALGREDIDYESDELPTAPRQLSADRDTPTDEPQYPLGLVWGEHLRDSERHIEWHAPCGCAYHPKPFPHVHPCSDEHKRPDLHL